jgi:L-ascorbate 6-phosphate lactonase
MDNMSQLEEITRESWILETFPPWGTWLNEEIEAEVVKPGTFAMWWLACTGIWIKTEGDTNICIDLWCGTGNRTHGNGLMPKGAQLGRMSGCRKLYPILRLSPAVIDPFAIRKVDAIMATHSHRDHIDRNVAAAVVKNCDPSVPFIGPKSATDLWKSWGVPAERCITMRPGDTVKIGDTEVVALESFDRTMTLTMPAEETSAGKMPRDMDDLALNYLFKTPAGNLYHSGDSHYSNYYVKHGNEHHIDVALGSFSENSRGITDKMTAKDILRMAEALNTRVMIPIHWDLWSIFQGDIREITVLWEMSRRRLRYKFTPYIWQVGGKYVWPDEKDEMEYEYPRGFDDAFTDLPDVPFPSFL